MNDCGCDEILLPQGSNGVNGMNAFTFTTAGFVQPAIGSTVQIIVSDVDQFTNQWAIPGQIIRITDAAGAGGWYEVISINGTTQIVVENLGYPGSSSPTTSIASGAGVSPAGLQGPAGSDNVLSISAVNTLPAGSPATVSISGTSPTQQLTFGIPVGATGATGAAGMFSSKILYSDNASGPSYGTISNLDAFLDSPAVSPTFQSLLTAPLTINAADLCPNNGDYATINVRALIIVGSNPKSYMVSAWRFKLNSVIIGTNPSENISVIPSVPLVFPHMNGSSALPSGPLSTGTRYVDLELIIQRVTSTVAKIYCKGSRGGPYNSSAFSNTFAPTQFFKSNIVSLNFSNPSLPIDIEGAIMTDKHPITSELATIRTDSILIQTFRQS